jgi:hypothetical protein
MRNGLNIQRDGTKKYYLNNELHREDGPAVEFSCGTKYWYVNGQLHREDGPAKEYVSGDRYWYLNNGLYKEDEPAAECASGSKFWFINGKELSVKKFQQYKKRKEKISSKIV